MLTFKEYKPENNPAIYEDGYSDIKTSLSIYKTFDCFTITEQQNLLSRMEAILSSVPRRILNEVCHNKKYKKLVKENADNYTQVIDEAYSLSFLESKPENRIRKLAERAIMTRFCKANSSHLSSIHELFELLSKTESIIEQRLMLSKPKGTLNIFDIDDTLFRTDDKVKVIVKGKIVKELDSEAFAHYHLKPGERFDFSDFRNGKKFLNTARPIKRMMSFATRLVKFSGPQSRTVIITARDDFDDKGPFLQRFREAGFPIDDVYVFRAGRDKQAGSTGEAKKKIIDKLLASGKYDTVRMWDDSTHNLDAFLYLKRHHQDVSFEGYRVDPSSGTTSPVH